MSEKYSNNLDWWVEGPASRNTLSSPFYQHYCGLFLLESLLKNKYAVREIITDSIAFSKILKWYLKKNAYSIPVKNIDNTLVYHLMKLFKYTYLFFKELYSFFCHYWYSRKTIHLKASAPDIPLILIDTFSFPGYIDKDRYYNYLWDSLDNDQRKHTYFVPSITMVKLTDLLSAYSTLRLSCRNYLIKQDYLQIKDIIYALTHSLRVMKLKVKPVSILGVDIAPLVKEELRSTKGYSDAVEALLNYRFAKRLRERNIKLRLVVDWFENQVIDKGWNAGFNKYYPNVVSKGYRGSAPPLLYISSSTPSKVELTSGVLPSIISVIGDGYINSTKEFSCSLIVEKAPAFRYKHLWNKNVIVSNSNKCTILIALSYFIEESVHILQLVINALDINNTEKYSFFVSPHPTISGETLHSRFGENWPESFNIIADVNKLLFSSDILISGGLSGVCLESAALGIPVIVVENPFGFSCNSIPPDVPQDLWKSSRTSKDIKNSIEHFNKMTVEQRIKNRKLSKKIRKEYFEPVSKEGVMKFLNLNINN
jgi:hypothetical protein